MAKPRVHEIASDLGIDTKLALAKLKEMGEFVKAEAKLWGDVIRTANITVEQ